MAEWALLSVAKKISHALGKEAYAILSSQLKTEVSLLTELPSRMNRIRREFVLMQSLLSEIDTEQVMSRPLAGWLEEVRKLANDAEDTIDEYIHLLGGKHRNGFMSSIEIWIRRSPNILAWREIASKLKELESELSHVSQMKDTWIKIPEGVATSSSTYAVEAQQRLPDSSLFIEDADFIGNKNQKKMLTDWLAVDQDRSRTIISVWGMGGSGKTTLVHNVYKTEQGNFDCHAWITVSQTYAIEDLLRRLVEKLFEQNEPEKPKDLSTKNGGELKQMLQDFLKERRYLIILDDVWKPAAFQDIKDAFVENERRSRIVITTRIGDVANFAADDRKLELKGLEEGEAWDLFCKKAFWRDKERKCPEGLLETAKKILSKCDGLPLAIVSIGSLMSFKEKTKAEWEKVYKQLDFELDCNENLSYMKQILNLSYKSLPRHLKNCFLYFSFFPEDYSFGRKQFIRLWVAEGFVEEVGERTMEEVAEDYLWELSQRCMLQVVDRNRFGRMRRFQMHDLVRDLAISISKRENFTVICGNQEARINNEARRLSVHAGSKHIQSLRDFRQLRSFLVFTGLDIQWSSSKLLSQLLSTCRYLMVLNLQDSGIESVPKEVGDLFNLHYLNLRRTRVKELPKSIGRLHNLQTLDTRRSRINMLPGWITKLRNLRHLLVGELSEGVPIKHLKGPPNFRGLQTLRTVESSIEVVEWLGHLTHLRTLEMTQVKDVHCAKLCSSMAKMRFLSKLHIEAADQGKKLVLVGLDPPLQNLEKLRLRGELDTELAESPFFRSLHVHDSLRKLSLWGSGIRQDPLPFLCSMSNLSFLYFYDAYQGQRLLFRKGWFPHLKRLWLSRMPNLDKVIIEEGAMERLEYLELYNLPVLTDIPEGIESLMASLREISIIGMPSEFRERIEKVKSEARLGTLSNSIEQN